MKYSVRTFLFGLLFVLSVSTYGQTDIDSLNLALHSVENPKQKVDILLLLSDRYKNINPDKSLDYAEKAYIQSTQIDYQKATVKALIDLSEIYWGTTDFKTAIEYAQRAKQMAEELGLKKELALSLRSIGLIFIELNDYEKSSGYFFDALKLFEEINDKQGIAKIESDIGALNFYQANYDKALEYFFLSLKTSKETNNREGISRALNNIAAVYETTQDYQKAIQYFMKASEMNRELGNRRSEGINYMNLGTINFMQKNYDESLGYYNKALDIFTDLQSKILQARCHVNMANYFVETGDSAKSMTYARLALNEGKEQHLTQVVYDAAQIIHKIFLEKGDKEKAYDYLLLQFQMKDSLVSMENKAELAKLELQYKFTKKEQAKKIEQQRKNLYILFIIISLLLALIIIILVLARWRVKAKNALIRQKMLEQELEFKKKELTINVMSLMKKNEMLSTISDNLISVKNSAVKDETKFAITRVSKELQKITDREILEEFEMRFKEVHKDFYEKLIRQFPDLSPNEQRLCAFLRLNMTTKEISELTGQRPGTLETARYRLRKKLGLTNSQTNLVTFLSQL